MRQLQCGQIKLPKIYVVDNVKDINICREHGIPYLVWRGSDEDLIKMVLYPTLVKLFPHIRWEQVLGINYNAKQTVVKVPGRTKCSSEPSTVNTLSKHDGNSGIATSTRLINAQGKMGEEVNIKLDEYVGDLSAKVNIEELQDLHLLPSFLDEITNNIKKNLFDLAWWEGYNKKLGVPIGNFNGGSDAPNLIILDVSHSIPPGIAATMLSLIETLRSQANADLIITASWSKFYPRGSDLPSPQKLRNMFAPSNESKCFKRELKEHVLGRTYSNVISFGDWDTPNGMDQLDYSGTTIHHVWHYHTGRFKRCNEWITGYAEWVNNIIKDKANIHYNTSWCSIIC